MHLLIAGAKMVLVFYFFYYPTRQHAGTFAHQKSAANVMVLFLQQVRQQDSEENGAELWLGDVAEVADLVLRHETEAKRLAHFLVSLNQAVMAGSVHSAEQTLRCVPEIKRLPSVGVCVHWAVFVVKA